MYQQMMEESNESLRSLTKRDVTEMVSFSKPPQGVADILNHLFIILGAKSEKDMENKKKGMRSTASFISELMYFDIESIDFSTLKMLKNFLEKYPDPDYFSKVSKACHSFYLWIKSIYNARIFHQFYSAKARLGRNPSWDVFVQKNLICFKIKLAKLLAIYQN